ncbi:MAG: type II toxin-antitoxin system RelE/ParE family toxin [Nitrospirae bacterium]|nr:type II toxin-antitoxin system RelE/ParE family toxin [Nitrospirota bacterium]
MDVLYKSAFRRFVKKQSRPLQLVIEDETEKIKRAPEVGEAKKGDLTGLCVHKFKFKKQEYLMAYRVKSDYLIMYMVDTHENFYRNLKRYIREVE